jgi:hypothetical protein
VTEAQVLPRPKAATGVVFHDVLTRTLTVRLGEGASGYERLLWRDGWQALRRDQEAGWPVDGSPPVFAAVPGARRGVHGQPVEGGALSFHFPPGTAGYAELVARPGLYAIVTMDSGTRYITNVRFLNRFA